MANKIQFRRDTAANWTAANPVLALGEPGYETDSKKHKIGNGTAAWATLGYQAPDEAGLATAYAAPASVRKGLVPANPNTRRILGAPTVMASPPTVTQGAANAASAITSAQTLAITSTLFRRFGAPAGFGSSFPDNSEWQAPDQIAFFGQVPTIKASGAWGIEFMHDGSQVEFQSKHQAGSYYWIMVDGQWVTAAPVTGPTTSVGSGYRVLIDFGTRAVRRIRVAVSGPTRLGQVKFGPNDTIWAPNSAPGPRTVVIGDSFVDGTGGTGGQPSNFVSMFGHYMGWNNVRCAGEGGTGYLATGGGGGKEKYRDRVTADVAAWGAEIVIVQGSVNDGNTAANLIGAEADLLFASVKAAAPLARLVVLLPFAISGTQTAGNIANRDAIKVSALAAGADLIVDPIADAWFTGTGRVGTPSGTGNSDLYMGSDNVHPSQAGHEYIARRLTAAIQDAIDSGALM